MLAMRAPHSKGPMSSTILWLIEDKPEIYVDLLYSVRNSDCTGRDDSFSSGNVQCANRIHRLESTWRR